jgi:WhiB family transcriptional regulator, redox-sensing transcriptional regulator
VKEVTGMATIRWQDRAACRDEDPELFFPVGVPTAKPYQAQEADAKKVCARCPVRTECLTWALETGLDHGVWGGLTEHERRALLARRARRRKTTKTA